MYAAYSAAFSRMLSDSTPGPRDAGAGRCGRCLACRPSFSEKVAVADAAAPRRRGAAASGCATQRALPQQRPMIAKQRHRRHRRRQRRERGGEVGIARAARRRPRRARGRRSTRASQSMAQREPLASLVLRRPASMRAASATGDSAPGFASAASQSAALLPATPGRPARSASSGAPPACASTARGVGDALRREPRDARPPASGAAPASRRQRLRSVARHPPGLVRHEDEVGRRAAAPRASSAARWPPARSCASAGTITATFARPRWLVSCAQSVSAADRARSWISVERPWPRRPRRPRRARRSAGRDAGRRRRSRSPGTCRTPSPSARGDSHSSAAREVAARACACRCRAGPSISSACGQRRARASASACGRALPRQQRGPRRRDGRRRRRRAHQRSAATMPRELRAHVGHGPRRVDDAEAPRLGAPRARGRRRARARRTPGCSRSNLSSARPFASALRRAARATPRAARRTAASGPGCSRRARSARARRCARRGTPWPPPW